ncbi:MAG: winged helix-turn-helix domain-containing protein, partial [Thermoanaerobaculia bacterium]
GLDSPQPMKIRFGECVLETDERVLLRGGQPVHLTPKAFQLLGFLVEVRPRAVPKSELQEKLWPATFVSEGNLATLVKEARIAIGDDARQPLYIRTVHGYGYAFAGTVEPTGEAAHSIVILPFENLTGDRALDYLCDGVAENLTNAFSRVARFRVLSPRTAFRWKGSSREPEAIGRELQVETVVHGRVTGATSGLTVQVDAVDVASGTQIWGNRFRPEADQVFRIEEDVAAEVVAALQLRLSADDQSRLVHRYTSNPHAYDLYLRGRFQWNKRTEEGLLKGIEHFQRAIVADPEYALPHSGIADVYAAMGTRDLMAPREAFSRALQSATRALELAPNLAEALVSLAAIAEVHQWDWSEAGRKYRRAIELSPSYATAYQWYALHFARRGLAADAELQMAKALDLDPLSRIGLTNAALLSYLARDDLAASERIERALEVEPDSVDALLVRGGVHEANGRLDPAIADYRAAIARSSRYTTGLAFLGHALGRRGDRDEAEEILQRLDTMRRTQHVSAMDSALVALGLNRFDVMFAWLEAAVREKSGWLVYLKTDPRLDPLHGDPRFESLLRAVDLASGNP